MPNFFALSWCITWFAHDVETLATRARLFDVCIAYPPEMAYYLSAAVRWPCRQRPPPARPVRVRTDRPTGQGAGGAGAHARGQLVLASRAVLLEVPCEADQLHAALGRLARAAWDADAIVARAVALFDRHPPATVTPLASRGVGSKPAVVRPDRFPAQPLAWATAALLSASVAVLYMWLDSGPAFITT